MARATQTAARKQGARRRRRRSQRSTILLRAAFVAVLGLVAFLYYRPLTSLLETRAAVDARAAEVEVLREENRRLEQRLARASTLAALAREARRSGLVRPGERLYVVRGIEEWRRAHRTMRRDG